MKLSLAVPFAFLVFFVGCHQPPLDGVDLYLTDEEARFPADTLHDVPPPDTFIPRDLEPIAIRMLKPEYPVVALHKELAANVAVKVWVTTQGTVRRAVIFKSPDVLFNKSALRAAMGWYFNPASFQSKPVACWTIITMGFRTTRTKDVEIIQ